MQFSSGLVCRKHIKAEEDADVVKLMKNAGAILLCTTNVSEIGLYYEVNFAKCTNKTSLDLSFSSLQIM